MLNIFVLFLVLISVCGKEQMSLHYIWKDNSVVIFSTIRDNPRAENCRFVRDDGLSFDTENAPTRYIIDLNGPYGPCALTILDPTSEHNVRTWTMIAKLFGEDTELSGTTNWDPKDEYDDEPWTVTRGLPRPAAIALMCFFSALLICLVIVALIPLLPKKNINWIHIRIAFIKNSFRKPPQHQHHNEELKPVQNESLADSPRKV